MAMTLTVATAGRRSKSLLVAVLRLHARQRAQAKQLQARLEHPQRAGTEQQTAGPHGGIVHRDLVGVVECAEFTGKLVEVKAEKVRPERVGRDPDGVGKFHELAGERKLARRLCGK